MRFLPIPAVLLLAGCTSTAHIRGADGEALILVECGASTSFAVCHERAAQECPDGYRTVEERSGFNRKELRVACLEDSP